ncbi:MAG TPA: Crp/Fnr family transcriptional regulator [Prolixibacteraceae bacterium]|nr:Crp/Fnr family transcriptional regulator [Prolixibacteraceae bacterium]
MFLTAREMGLLDKLHPVHILFKKRETICKQGSTVSHAHILLAGSAKMYINGINERNIILNILMPSNYIGLLGIFGISSYNYSVAALDNSHVCQVEFDFVKELYASNVNFMANLNHAFGESVVTIMQKLISLNQKQIRGKVAESLLYLSRLYESESFVLTITRKELGELSAISEENAVRVLTEFRQEDIIQIKGKEILLRNVPLLNKISELG